MSKNVGWTAAALVAGGIIAGGYVASGNHKDSRPGPDVRIELKMADGKSATCSGVYVGKGIVLTAKHCVVDDVESYRIIFDKDGVDGPEITAVADWKADKADIATLKLSGTVDVRGAGLACRDPKIGEPIEVVGNPLGQTFIHTWGKVAGVVRSDKDENFIVPIDAMIASGNSGGPVFDADGNVIGIADAVVHGEPLAGTGIGHIDLMVSVQAACGQLGK